MEREQTSQIKDYLELNHLLRNEAIGVGLSRLGYVVSETSDNQPATLLRARDFLNWGVIEKIAISDPLPPYVTGFPGPEYCTQILIDSGVKEEDIVIIQPKVRPPWNTQSELATVAKYLETSKDKNILLITPWFHTLRTYITALSEFKNLGLLTKVFVSSVDLNPYEEVTHSQGIQRGTRRKLFSEEIQKCIGYKNLISVSEAFQTYKRDRGLIYGQ